MKWIWSNRKKVNTDNQESGAVPAVKLNLGRPLVLIVILIALAIGASSYLKTNKETADLYEEVSQKVRPIIRTIMAKLPIPAKSAPKGESIKLTLKTGRQFEGVLIKKNDQGYWIFVEGTGEVFFSPGEIAEVS